MFFCFCKDCNDVIARVVTNLNLITACYSPQKEPHYDTVPEQEDSRPRFVFTHHHFPHFFWIRWNFLPLSYKAIANILRHFLFQVLCGSNSDFLWKDNPKFAMGCYAKPFSMSHKATPAAVINRPRGHTKCQLWADASILIIIIIINTSIINCLLSRSITVTFKPMEIQALTTFESCFVHLPLSVQSYANFQSPPTQ